FAFYAVRLLLLSVPTRRSSDLIAVGDPGAAPVPTPSADDVHGRRGEGVGGADDRADIRVVPEILDRHVEGVPARVDIGDDRLAGDRKSTRLNSSHVKNSYAVFC